MIGPINWDVWKRARSTGPQRFSGGVAAQELFLGGGELGVCEFALVVAMGQVFELCYAIAEIGSASWWLGACERHLTSVCR